MEKKVIATVTTAEKLNAERKQINTTTADIGTAASGKQKAAAISKASKSKDCTPVFRVLCSAALTAHRSAVSPKALKAAKVSEDDTAAYLFEMSMLYNAAARYADVCNGGTKEAVEAALNSLFTQWKSYLAMLTGKPVKACGADEVLLYRSITRTVKEGHAYAAKSRDDGSTACTMTKGTAHTAVNSPNAFQKEVERLAVERILGFDGVVSANKAKDIAKANGDKRTKEVARHEKGMEIVETPKETAETETKETAA